MAIMLAAALAMQGALALSASEPADAPAAESEAALTNEAGGAEPAAETITEAAIAGTPFIAEVPTREEPAPAEEGEAGGEGYDSADYAETIDSGTETLPSAEPSAEAPAAEAAPAGSEEVPAEAAPAGSEELPAEAAPAGSEEVPAEAAPAENEDVPTGTVRAEEPAAAPETDPADAEEVTTTDESIEAAAEKGEEILEKPDESAEEESLEAWADEPVSGDIILDESQSFRMSGVSLVGAANAPIPGSENSPTFLEYLGLGNKGAEYYKYLQKYSTESGDSAFFMGTPYTFTVNMPLSDIKTDGFQGAWFMCSPRGRNVQGINVKLANASGRKYLGGMNCTGFGTALFSQFGVEQGRNVDGLLPGRRQNGTVVPGYGGFDWNYFLPGNAGFGKVKMYMFGNVNSGNNTPAGNWESVKAQMLNSGVLEYGDIIYCVPAARMSNASGAYDTHWGLYIGDGHSDRFWHSTYGTGQLRNGRNEIVSLYDWNVVTQIYPKYANTAYVVIKAGGGKSGFLKIHKEIVAQATYKDKAPKDFPENYFLGTNYSPEGAQYTVYSDSACTKKVTTLTIGAANGRGNQLSAGKLYGESQTVELPVGTYYVRETKAPTQGWADLDGKTYTVRVTENNTASQPVVVGSKDGAKRAWYQIDKVSTDPDVDASMAGAKFGIYKWNSDGKLSGYLGYVETNANGSTGHFLLPCGKVYIKELQPPTNGVYKLNDGIFEVTLEPGGYVNENLKVPEDVNNSGSLQIVKEPEESAKEIVTGNSCYSLEGAVFEVYEDKACTKPVSGGTLTTGPDGRTPVLDGLKAGKYYIVEKTPSKGFGLPKSSFTKVSPEKVIITENDIASAKTVIAKCCEPLKNDPIAIVISKVDAEGAEIAPLTGAKFAINYYNGEYTEETLPARPMWTWVVQTIDVNGVYRAGLTVETNTERGPTRSFLPDESDPLYLDTQFGMPTIPYGTVSVVELAAPEGYLFEAGKVLGVYVINEDYNLDDGFVMVDGVATLEKKVEEKRARYGISFTKADSEGTRLKNVPFLIRNIATGEQHIVLTDANGFLSTEGNKHSINTNANDAALRGGRIDESELDASAGVWFSGNKPTDLTHIDDARGALPYGDYRITELRSSANEGLSLIAPFTVKISAETADGTVIDRGTKVDENKSVSTAVKSVRTETQAALAEKNAAFEDKVTLSGFKGACSITTRICDTESKEQLTFTGGSAELVTEVTANGEETEVTVPFTFDASRLAGRTVAVVTTVANGGETIVHNEDLADEAEKIYFPTVSTKATVGGKKAAMAGGTKTIKDAVTYSGFPEGTKVKAVARAYKNGASASDDVLIATASKTEPFKADGSFTTNLAVNTDELAGETVFVSERIYVTVGGRDLLIAQENGRNIADQNVTFIELKTKVVNAETGSGLAFAKADAAFTDTLTIAGITGEAEAVMKLYNVTDGAYAQFADGSSEIRTAISADGSRKEIAVPFTVDGTACKGKVLSIETAVTCGGNTFTHNAAHDDADETIYFPAITTVAEGDNGHYISLADAAEVTDTVTWAGMPAGTPLTTKTRVFIKGETAAKDKEITEAALTSGYTVESTDGSHDVVVVLDTAKYAGSVLYITEEDYVAVGGREVLIASETDREAIDQYICIPKLITTAVATDTKEKAIPSIGNVSITDTVDFSGFKAGETMTTVTEAWAKGDKADADKLITSVEGTYTTETEKGSYDVILKFAITDDIAGKPVYVVEKNYIDGKLVSTEGGRDNAKQTVTPVTIATTLTDTKTKTHTAYAGKKVILRDEVRYDGLIEGKEYRLYTLLQNEEGFACNTKGEVTGIIAADALRPDKDLGPEDPPMASEVREAKIKEVIDANELIFAETVCRAEAARGSFFIDIEFEGVPFKGEKTVAAEGLYEEEGDGKLLALHSDPKDKDQTVGFPKVLTTAADKATGTKMVGAFDGRTVIDTVDYEQMPEGTTIVTVTELVKKGETAEEDEVITTVRSEQEVSGNGSYTVEIPLDASDLAGSTLYITERSYIVKEDGSEEIISDHVDRDDESQTVYVPKLITSAEDAKDGTKRISELDGEDAKVKDTVNYEKMVPGTPVITVAKLYVKGETAEEDEVIAEVKADAAMLIEAADGSYEVEIPFDAAGLGGRTLYVTEENYLIVVRTDEDGNETEEEVKISEHADRDDEEQTVKVPKIGTTLTDDETGTHISFADADVSNTDVIAFEGLEKDVTYKALCIYMDDKGRVYRRDGSLCAESAKSWTRHEIVDTVEEAEALINADGVIGRYTATPDGKYEVDYQLAEPVCSYYSALDFMKEFEEPGTTEKLDAANILYALTDFKADAEDGTASVTIHYDGTPFLGKKMAAAEGVYENGALLAIHIEPGDEKQTVYLPKIITSAVNTKTGGKHLLAEAEASVTDTIDYEKMPEGTTVSTVTELVLKGETEAEDTAITTVRSTQAVSGKGRCKVAIPFDASELGGRTLYVTERVCIEKEDGSEEIISEHVDRDDEEQTVYVPKMGTTLIDTETHTHISYGDETVTNIDTIVYENMPVGEHEVITVYMDDNGYAYKKDGTTYTEAKAETLNTCTDDTLTAEEKLDAVESNLKALGILYARRTVTLTEKNGSVEVEVSYNGVPFLGKKVVAGETMYDESGSPVAMHFMPKDEGQTIRIPKIITTAADGRDGDKVIPAANGAVIRDTLQYKMYPEGTEITTVLEVFDTATDKPLLVDGVPVTAEKTFRTDASGRTEITVNFNSTSLAGRTLGITEKNYLTVDGERVLVSEDSYRSNKEQIVKIVEDEKPGRPPEEKKPTEEKKQTGQRTRMVKTGDESHAGLWLALLMAAAIIVFAAVIAGAGKRKR